MTLSKLSKKQLVFGGNITLIIDNLEKNGLVERIKNKNNRRSIKVKLTSKEEKLFNSIFIKHVRYIMKLISVLS